MEEKKAFETPEVQEVVHGFKVFRPDWTYNDWLRSDARYLLNRIPKNVVEWIYSEDMTDEEKQSIRHTKQQAVISKFLMNLIVVSYGGAACQTVRRISSRRYRTLTLKSLNSVRVSM